MSLEFNYAIDMSKICENNVLNVNFFQIIRFSKSKRSVESPNREDKKHSLDFDREKSEIEICVKSNKFKVTFLDSF